MTCKYLYLFVPGEREMHPQRHLVLDIFFSSPGYGALRTLIQFAAK